MEYYGLEVMVWAAGLVLFAAAVIVQAFFLLNLRDLLREVSPQHRAMEPNQVWLNFIPLFGIVWMFFTVIRVKDSVQAEFQARGWARSGDFGYGVGMAYAILTVFAGLLTLIPGLVCWIIYWLRTAELKSQLRAGATSQGFVSGPPAVAGSSQGLGQGGPGPAGQRAELHCPKCGLLALPEDDFCRSCGYDLRDQAQEDETTGSDVSAVKDTCPFCGAAYRPDAKFCSTCGRPVV